MQEKYTDKQEELKKTYGKTFKFIINVDRINDKERMAGKVIAEQEQIDEVIPKRTIRDLSVDDFQLLKKIKMEDSPKKGQ